MKNVRKVILSEKSPEEKIEIISSLLLKIEKESLNRYFWAHPSHNNSFIKDSWGIRPDFTTSASLTLAQYASVKNPWLVFLGDMRQLVTNTKLTAAERHNEVERALDWFYINDYRESWVK